MCWLLGLVLLFMTGCAAVRPPGLPAAAPREAVAAVVRYHAGVYWCSAVAVAPELAITAAHCVHSTDAPVLEAAGQPARVVDSIGVVDGLVVAQHRKCAICQESGVGRGRAGYRPLAVDHDHKTGAVRGLLCYSCNVALGHFRDDPARLEAAAAYLRRS